MPLTDTAALIDRQSITEIIHHYCRSMDRMDKPLGYSVWHQDGTADYGDIYQGTGQGFIDWVTGFHEGIDGHMHTVSNILIDLQGDKAGSETYVLVGLLHKQDGAQVLTSGRGRYLDRWSKRDGKWAIDHRNFVLDFAVTQPVTANLGTGIRGPQDPSYATLGSPER